MSTGDKYFWVTCIALTLVWLVATLIVERLKK